MKRFAGEHVGIVGREIRTGVEALLDVAGERRIEFLLAEAYVTAIARRVGNR
jgi:hypothetical protein